MNPGRGRLVQLLFGLYPAQVLYTLAELRIPEQLAKSDSTLPDLAAATGTHLPSLRRLLRAAAGLGLVAHRDDGTVTLTPDGALLLPDTPGSIRNLVLLWGGDAGWRSWGRLADSVRTGRPAYDEVVGQTLFERLSANPGEQAVFNEAMAESTRAAAAAIVDACDLQSHRRLTDVGGADGTLLAALLAANPHLHGVLFDRPVSVVGAADVLGTAGVSDRATVVGGDFFERVPDGSDAYLLKSVLHDWDDERCIRILRNVRDATPEGGALYIVEPVVPTRDDDLARESMMLISDLNMLVCTGGVERTEGEFAELVAAAGYRLAQVTRCAPPSNLSVLRSVAV